MPIGSNAGGQLNILVFEVGVAANIEAFGVQAELVSTVSVHPMLVSPTSWGWNDSSRSAVMQTLGGGLHSPAGRALRTGNFEGTFGVESRGLAFYIGNGDIRFQRFYKEVVRMGEAMSAEQVDAAVDILNGTPGISLLVEAYDEETCNFFVNVYDFWNDVAMQCVVRNFRWRREFQRGGASGQVHYSMQVDEVGPIVEGGLGSTVLSALLAFLTTWDDINDVIESYTVDTIIQSIVSIAAIAVSEFADSLAAIQAQVSAVQGLMGATTSQGTRDAIGLSGFMAAAGRLETAARDMAARVSTARSSTIRAELGRTNWATQEGEGGSPALTTVEAVAALLELADAAKAQQSMGVFFGLDRETYQVFIASGGSTSTEGPDTAGSITHVVTDTDTPDSIATAYGVDWARILAVNRLTPWEALRAGTELTIPKARAKGQQGIEGLPTFGSHLGQSAWGVDLGLELLAGSDGDFALVSGPAVLVQGADFIAETFGDAIMAGAQQIHDEVRLQYIAKRLAETFKSDQRVKSVSDVNVQVDANGALGVAVTLHAINGGTIRSAER